MSSGSVTLSDVARRAGVSLATASRVLNGSARTVGPEMRERVLAVARELEYIPNVQAQAVARGATNVLGLVVHDIDDPYFSAIAAGVMREAEDRGCIVTLGSTRRSFARESEYVATLRAQRARAIVLVGSRSTDPDEMRRLAQEITGYRRGGGRVAVIGQQSLQTDTVTPENRAGARALAHALHDLGHRRYVVLAGPPHLLTARDRLEGFRRGLADRGVEEGAVEVVHGEFTRDGGFHETSRLAAEGLRASCIFAVNDVMAVGTMAALRQHGLRIPEDVSVAGFDDIATLRDVVPALTTVRLPLEAMGVQAARLALDGGDGAGPRVERVSGEVILRDSSRVVAA